MGPSDLAHAWFRHNGWSRESRGVDTTNLENPTLAVLAAWTLMLTIAVIANVVIGWRAPRSIRATHIVLANRIQVWISGTLQSSASVLFFEGGAGYEVQISRFRLAQSRQRGTRS
jgi:hypothetical protein